MGFMQLKPVDAIGALKHEAEAKAGLTAAIKTAYVQVLAAGGRSTDDDALGALSDEAMIKHLVKESVAHCEMQQLLEEACAEELGGTVGKLRGAWDPTQAENGAAAADMGGGRVRWLIEQLRTQAAAQVKMEATLQLAALEIAQRAAAAAVKGDDTARADHGGVSMREAGSAAQAEAKAPADAAATLAVLREEATALATKLAAQRDHVAARDETAEAMSGELVELTGALAVAKAEGKAHAAASEEKEHRLHALQEKAAAAAARAAAAEAASVAQATGSSSTTLAELQAAHGEAREHRALAEAEGGRLRALRAELEATQADMAAAEAERADERLAWEARLVEAVGAAEAQQGASEAREAMREEVEAAKAKVAALEKDVKEIAERKATEAAAVEREREQLAAQEVELEATAEEWAELREEVLP